MSCLNYLRLLSALPCVWTLVLTYIHIPIFMYPKHLQSPHSSHPSTQSLPHTQTHNGIQLPRQHPPSARLLPHLRRLAATSTERIIRPVASFDGGPVGEDAGLFCSAEEWEGVEGGEGAGLEIEYAGGGAGMFTFQHYRISTKTNKVLFTST
jgi:hypothetical protein